MKHLKTYEGFEIGDFKTFIDKYKKKGYISRTDMKRMDATDKKYSYFSRILQKIDICYNFFNINDVDLLSDLMLDVYDEFPTFDTNSIRYSFGISYEDKVARYTSYAISNHTNNIGVSVNNRGSEISKYGDDTDIHIGLKDKKDVVQNIINSVIKDRESSIKSKEDEIRDTQRTRRPGVKSYGEETLRQIKTMNPFRDLKIKANLHIDIKISEEDFNRNNNDRYYMVQNFNKLAKAQLERYFSMLNINHLTHGFEITCDNDYHYTNHHRYTVHINV